MLQLVVLRQDKELVKKKLAIKNYKAIDLVDKIISLDDTRKKIQSEYDTLQAEINAASKEIGKLIAQQKNKDANTLKNIIAKNKDVATALAKALTKAGKDVQDTLVLLPNLPAIEVPEGKNPEDNEVVRTGGIHTLPDNPLPHWDLIKQYDLIDFETGAKIAGSGFPLYKGKGAKLQRALTQYFLDFNIAAGYCEYVPPYMVNEASAFATGQLPDKEGQMYHAVADNFYLIPTAEVPITNIYRNEIVDEIKLPIKMTAYSPCFRREAGSFGKDVRGLNRVHQFEKVEIVQIVKPDTSYATLEAMVMHVETLLQSLELPYRILRLCGGDMSFASALTYDFEVFSVAQKRWLEVSSVSNFETFQTHRMKCRYKDAAGKIHLLHSLNGSALALPRIVACLLENNQTPSGIVLPQVLHQYFGANKIV